MLPTAPPKMPLLWPVLAGVGVAAAVAAVVLVVALSTRRDIETPTGRRGPLSILVAVPVDDNVVRAVTEEGGCRRPLFADVRVRNHAVELRVIGQDPGGGCTAEIKIRCSEVRLPPAAATKRLVAMPLTARAGRVSAKTLARQSAAGVCPRLPLR
jgi:hypothetical protein